MTREDFSRHDAVKTIPERNKSGREVHFIDFCAEYVFR